MMEKKKKFSARKWFRVFLYFLILGVSFPAPATSCVREHANAKPIGTGKNYYKLAQEAEQKYQEARRRRDTDGMAEALLNEAAAHIELADISEALHFLQEARQIISDGEVTARAAKLHFLLGKAEKERNQLRSANGEILKALQIFQQVPDSSGIAECYSQAGSIAWKGHDYQQAYDWFGKALGIYKAIRQTERIGLALINLGVVCTDAKRFEEAENWFRQALEVYQKAGDRAGVGKVLHHYGVLYYRIKDFRKAEEYYRRSASQKLSIGDTTVAASTMLNLALVYREQGLVKQALDECNRAIDAGLAARDTGLLVAAYLQAGSVSMTAGEYVKAHEYFLRGLLASLATSDSLSSSQAYANLASVFSQIGDVEKSVSYFEKSVNILPASAGFARQAYLLNQWGNALYSAKKYKQALHCFERALELARTYNDLENSALYLKNAGRAEAMLGNSQKALRMLDESIQLYQSAKNPPGILPVWNEKGNIHQQNGKLNEAYRCFDTLVFLARKYGDKSLLALGLRKKADIMLHASLPGDPEAAYLESLHIGESIPHLEAIQNALFSLAEFYAQKKRFQDAVRILRYYNAVHDSIINRKEQQQILFSQINFDIQLKDQELQKVSKQIEALEQQQVLSRIALERQKNINRLLGLVMLLTLVIVMLLFSRYRAKKKTAELLARQNEMIRQVNEQLKASEENLRLINQTKDRFFSIIAHDIRNPLTGILGFADLISRNLDSITRQSLSEMVGLMHQSASDLYDLLDNLLFWARSQKGTIPYRPQQLDLYFLADKTMQLLSSQAVNKKIHMELLVEKNSLVWGDPDMLTIVFRNLISNALKFTPAGGTVTISARSIDGYMEVSVKDTGIGIPDERLRKLFRIDEKVSTLGTENERGSGLGLILCKEFIEKHGGNIRVESREGQGSAFIFTLPSHGNTSK